MHKQPSFEWDQKKAQTNHEKHGIRFDEAASVFFNRDALIIRDEKHSATEERYVIVGTNAQDKILTIVFTEREANIRIISARPANVRERNEYEKNKKDKASRR